MGEKLFAVYLGGCAPKCNTELHDVVFVTGETIEDIYEQLMDKWFGTPKGLHIDSWMELDVVDGYKVMLTGNKKEGDKKLFFVNLGAYKDGKFSEMHANTFVVVVDLMEAKTRAKKQLTQQDWITTHTDNIYEVDGCVEIGEVNAFHIGLTKTDEVSNMKPYSGYHIVPKDVVEDYMRRKSIEDKENYR